MAGLAPSLFSLGAPRAGIVTGPGIPKPGRLPGAPKPTTFPGISLSQWNTPGAANANWTATNPNPGQRIPEVPTPGGAIAASTPTPAPAAAPSSGGGGSPLDATYFQNVADNLFKVQNQVNALNLTGSQDQTALQAALGQLAYQQPRDQLALEQRANQSGGLYSSVENMNQANLVHGYATRANAAQTAYQNQADRIAAQIAALQGSVPLYNQEQALNAGQRAALAAANNPALAAPAAAPAAAAPAGAGGRGRPSGVGRAGGALLGGFGALTQPRAGGAGNALSNRTKLANQLAGRKKK